MSAAVTLKCASNELPSMAKATVTGAAALGFCGGFENLSCAGWVLADGLVRQAMSRSQAAEMPRECTAIHTSFEHHRLPHFEALLPASPILRAAR